MRNYTQNSEWVALDTGRKKREPQISLSPSKYIRFNSAFLAQNKLDNKGYVKIFVKHEGDKVMLGFQFVDIKESKALKVSKNRKSGSGYCSGNSLFTELNIIPEKIKGKKFKPQGEELDGDTLYVIELKTN